METADKIKDVLTRSVSAIYPSREALTKELLAGRKLKIYLGVDPTGPHLHLGQLTNLLVLKKLQALGHEIIFLIGDFTARIGDPTDKPATRKRLTKEEALENMKTFKEQASRIISFSGKNPAKIKKNSEWYENMGLGKFMKDISGYFTVNNMLNRDMFKERKSLNDINFNELMYPLLQGYDSVALDVDVEIGGNDQIFNMNIGRALRWAHGNHSREAFFIATTLLVNPKTGKKLMNKSEGGMINLDDMPENIFGKVMALDDASIVPVAELCTEMPMAEVEKTKKTLAGGKSNPRDSKLNAAEAVVKTIYGEEAAGAAREKFIEIFSKKEMPEDLPTIKTSPITTPLLLAIASGIAKSNSEARRLAEQGAVEIDGKIKKDPNERLQPKGGEVVKIGKKNFFRIKI